MHKRTLRALTIATVGGYLGGGLAAGGWASQFAGEGVLTAVGVMFVGVGVSVAGVSAALWYAPDAERIAIEYREEQRIEERLGGGEA